MFKQLLQLSLIFVIFIFSSVESNSQKKNFDYLDLYDLQFANGGSISPNSEHIVYQRVQMDVMTDKKYTNLWYVKPDGTVHEPLTSGKTYYSSVEWSPDSKRIAYTSSEEGKSQIFVRWMDSGKTTSITNLTTGPFGLKWSPDGKTLLFARRIAEPMPTIGKMPSQPEGAKWASPAKVIRHVNYKQDGAPIQYEEGYVQLFLVSAEGGAPRQITSQKANHRFAQWKPDGKSVIFTADFSANADIDINNEHIYEMNISTGESKKITSDRGPYNEITISPDGSTIAYTGFVDKFLGYQQSELYIMDSKGGNKRLLTQAIDRDVNSLIWASDGKSIFYMYDEYGITYLANISLTGNVTVLTSGLGGASIGRPYTDGYYSMATTGRYVFSKQGPNMPSELVVGQFMGRMAEKQITNINGQLLLAKQMGKVEEFWINSSFDKMKIQGWIATPPDFDKSKKYPIILEIHGGPYTAYGPNFSPEIQLMVSQGYVVVYTNPRGSTSYGADFSAYINFNYPSEDYNDLMDCVDHVIGKGYIDTKNVFITGGSGGGVLTAWSIGKTNRFTAAVVAKPVINWFTHTLTADAYPFFSKYWFTKMPWEDPKQYMDRSPISLVGNVSTPTMLLTGDQDHRTPMSESEQYYQALKLRGIDAAMVRIADEGHEMTSRPSNLLRKVAYIVGWFDEHKSQ